MRKPQLTRQALQIVHCRFLAIAEKCQQKLAYNVFRMERHLECLVHEPVSTLPFQRYLDCEALHQMTKNNTLQQATRL